MMRRSAGIIAPAIGRASWIGGAPARPVPRSATGPCLCSSGNAEEQVSRSGRNGAVGAGPRVTNKELTSARYAGRRTLAFRRHTSWRSRRAAHQGSDKPMTMS